MLFIYYLKFLGLVLGVIVLGYLLTRLTRISFKNIPFFTQLFAYLLIGWVSFTSFVALYYTSFQTIHLVYFLLLGIGLTEYHIFKQKASTKKPFKPPHSLAVVCSVLLVSVLFLWRASKVTSWDGLSLAPSYFDHLFYSFLSGTLQASGQENTASLYALLDSSYQGVAPYHYFELWFISGITTLFDGLNLLNFELFTLPFIFSSVLLGLLAFWESVFGVHLKFQHILLSLLFIAVGGVVLPFYKELPYYTALVYYDETPIFSFKMSVVLIFYLSFCCLSAYRQYTIASLNLLLLASVNFSMLPTILGLIPCLLMYLWYQKRAMNALLVRMALYYVLGLGAVFLFYALFAPQTNTMVSSSLLISFDIFSFQYFKYIIGLLLLAILAYFPFLLLLLFLPKKQQTTWLACSLFVALVFLISSSVYFMLRKEANAMQLFQLPSIPLLTILVISILILFYHQLEKQSSFFKIQFLLFALVCLGLVYKEYTNWGRFPKRTKSSYVEKLTAEIEKKQQTTPLLLGAAIQASYTSHPYTANPIYIQKGSFLPLIANKCFSVSLSEHRFQLSGSENERRLQQNAISTGMFFQFVEKQKKAKTFQSIAQSQVDFIQKYQLKFLIMPKKMELHSQLQPYVEKVIETKDTHDQKTVFFTDFP